VPLTLANGRVYGALCVSSHAAQHRLGAPDLALMRFLSELVAAELAKQEQRTTARSMQRDRLSSFLEPGGITILAQPIVDLTTSEVRGVEALSRFAGHAGSPADVFATAADVGLGTALELAAIRGALLLLPQLPPQTYLSINAAPETALDPELHAILRTVDCERIVLELTEHVEFTCLAPLQEALTRMRSHGLRVAVDDTGSGYASLQNILALAPEVIKLDLGLVKGIDRDPVRRALARALSGFATECGAALIAEGIETYAELETLKKRGVTLGQGYYLARPAPIGDLDLGRSMTNRAVGFGH
jgi:EAL domain-containing protein (putative c-di-GMP-specific phosphodiesterase class I)